MVDGPVLILDAWNPAQAQEREDAVPASVAGDKAPAAHGKAVDLPRGTNPEASGGTFGETGANPLVPDGRPGRRGDPHRRGVASWAQPQWLGRLVERRPDDRVRRHARRLELHAIPDQGDPTDRRRTALDDRPRPGNCPEFAPDDEKIIFLLNSDAMPRAASGVWMPMKADGSERNRIESYGRPRWRPDNSRIMIIGFSVPHGVTLIDVAARVGKAANCNWPDASSSLPRDGLGKGCDIASIGEGEEADSIALIDVSDPGRCEVKEVLWKRNKGLDVVPMASDLSTVTGRCIFVGRDAKGYALYGFDRGKPGPRLSSGNPGRRHLPPRPGILAGRPIYRLLQ